MTKIVYPKQQRRRAVNPLDKVKQSKWQFRAHFNLSNSLVRIDSRTVCGILVTRELTTRKIHGGSGIGKTKPSYYIDQEKKEYKTVPTLIKQIKEMVRARKSRNAK